MKMATLCMPLKKQVGVTWLIYFVENMNHDTDLIRFLEELIVLFTCWVEDTDNTILLL